MAVLPLLHAAPWGRGAITAGLRRGRSRIGWLSVQRYVLVLQLILVLILVLDLVLMAGAAIGSLLEVPGVQEHGQVGLAGQVH